MIKFFLKLFLLMCLVGACAGAYYLFTNLSAGDRIKILDVAGTGDFEATKEVVKAEAKEQIDEQAAKAAAALKKASADAVEMAAQKTKKQVDVTANDAKRTVDRKVDQGLNSAKVQQEELEQLAKEQLQKLQKLQND